MNGKVNLWLVVAVAALAGAQVNSMLSPRETVAQGNDAARHIAAIAGSTEGGKAEQPIYIVDSLNQVMAVYEYGLGRSGLSLVATRKFQHDLRLEEFDIRRNKNRSPSVKDVKKMVK